MLFFDDDFGLGALGDGASRVLVFAILGGLGVAAIVAGVLSETTILQVSRVTTGVLTLGAGGFLAWMHRPGAERSSWLMIILMFLGFVVLGALAFVSFFFGELLNGLVN